MARLYAVTRTRVETRRATGRARRRNGHAKFMNGLHAHSSVLVGGPLEGTPDVLLIVCANDA
jgi:hypothetical protein